VREVETELRRELSLVEPLRGGNLEVAKRIAAARNPVSLHLRRGDYGPYFVFSDDVAFCQGLPASRPAICCAGITSLPTAPSPGGGRRSIRTATSK